jgi:hypothetical protein
MLQYNLTQRERQMLIRLLELSAHSKEQFEARVLDPAVAGPSGKLARLDFGGAGHSMDVTKRDLRVLKEAIALRFQKVTLELVELARQLIDADEARAAKHEAISIAEELRKDVPDETIITRKTKGFVSRLSLTFSGTADLALRGEKIGAFAERLAAWLVALSIWTEWHAAHHAAPDPCA